MAKPKKDAGPNWLEKGLVRHEQRKINNPVIAERWWVIDYWPPIQYWHDEQERSARSRMASKYFETRAEAEEFVNTHDPEPDAQLIIKHQNKRVITTEEWVNW